MAVVCIHGNNGEKTLKTLKSRPWIEHIDDERDQGNGIIITLINSMAFDLDPDCGVRGFDTLSEAEAETRRKRIVWKNK
jgi:hypothetical protein